VISRAFGAGFYFITVGYLLGYVLRRQTFTADKLYGAAAAFLMLGVLWSYFYAWSCPSTRAPCPQVAPP
jgi:hypothetical protein